MGSSEEKVTWTQKMIMKLIEEVEQRPCLWCRSDTEYSNKIFKSIAYQEIGEIVGVPAEYVRDKLRNLRINFMQVHKKQLTGGGRGGYPPKWEYYTALLFMVESSPASPASSPLLNSKALKIGKNRVKKETTYVTKRRKDSEGTGTTKYDIKRRQKSDESDSIKARNHRLDSVEIGIARKKKRQDTEEIESNIAIKQRLDSDETSTSLDPLSDEGNKPGVQSIAVKGSNERFGAFLTASLNSLDDARIVKRTKAKIQLIISEAITEHATMKLAECESANEF